MTGILAEATGEEPVVEYRFFKGRRWRLDYAWPRVKIGIEIQGGVWKFGRHTRGKGYEGDCEKLNTAQCLGWRIFWLTPGMVRDGRANELFDWIRKELAGE
jgi:hypothetical protein